MGKHKHAEAPSVQATIELCYRYPTKGLADALIPFLPNCGWKAVKRADWYYLQFCTDAEKARRVLTYLRAEYPTRRFTELEPSSDDITSL